MKWYKYVEPQVDSDGQPIGARVTVVSESEIIASYYLWWCQRMRELKREALISRQNCINDFVATQYAYEVDIDGRAVNGTHN